MISTLGMAAMLLLSSPAVSVGKNPPGTLIKIEAICTSSGQPTSASNYLVVLSPLLASLSSPVYLSQGWAKPDEPIGILAAGMLVRFLHRNRAGQLEVLEGIQLLDGRVLVDGVPTERNANG